MNFFCGSFRFWAFVFINIGFYFFRSVSPGVGVVDGGQTTTLPAHSPSLNSSHTTRSGSLPRPLSPSPSLTSDKNEQDFQVRENKKAMQILQGTFIFTAWLTGSTGTRGRGEETSTAVVCLRVTLRGLSVQRQTANWHDQEATKSHQATARIAPATLPSMFHSRSFF